MFTVGSSCTFLEFVREPLRLQVQKIKVFDSNSIHVQYENKLNSPYEGGMNSVAAVIVVIAYLFAFTSTLGSSTSG